MATLGKQGSGLSRSSLDTPVGSVLATNASNTSAHPSDTYKLIASLSPTQQSSSTASTLVTVSSHDSCISSVASESIVDLVLRQTLEWNVALSGFENALSTAEGQFMVNMIHSQHSSSQLLKIMVHPQVLILQSAGTCSLSRSVGTRTSP
ncbi:MAG: hypothetical protein J3Q66DRAFT_376156 [Benniella sp.]|nr:MAG: hypothetical protein J3Q66DRAFT_376156 [Benniella sp.]